MDVKGKITELFDTQKVTDSFQKREFVLEYTENPSYPEFLKFELIQDRCALLDSFNVGDEVRVHFNLKGRKWTDKQGVVKYFNSLQAWKLESDSEGVDTPPPPEQDWVSGGEGDESSDVLPF